MNIDSANDDIGACEIVINYYKKSLIICKGVLHVKDNNTYSYTQFQLYQQIMMMADLI